MSASDENPVTDEETSSLLSEAISPSALEAMEAILTFSLPDDDDDSSPTTNPSSHSSRSPVVPPSFQGLSHPEETDDHDHDHADPTRRQPRHPHPHPGRRRRRRRRRRKTSTSPASPMSPPPDFGGLEHLSETLDEKAWKSLVESSRARTTLEEFFNSVSGTKDEGEGEKEEGEEEGEKEERGEEETPTSPIPTFTRESYESVEELRSAELEAGEKDGIPFGTSLLDLPINHPHAALLTPSRQWIPEDVFQEECKLCMDHPVEGDGIFCPKCKTPICNECSSGMVRAIIEKMQGDLSAFPPRCECCEHPLILANFEMVLRKILPEVSAKGTRRDVLVKQYELIMIAAAFQSAESTETQISCPFCKCLTLYEDPESVVIIHCQNQDCGRCFCWRCIAEVPFEQWARYCQHGPKADGVDEVVTHYARCRSLDHVRKAVEDSVSWGTVNRCPTCHVPGRKDTACTHISHSHCAGWCYVCEKVLTSDHNSEWETNPNRCPMYLHKIHEFDSSWPADPAEAVRYYHLQKTLRALRNVVDHFGIMTIALLKRDCPGVFGGYSLGQIMSVGSDEPMYVRRGDDYELPPTPTTESILSSVEPEFLGESDEEGSAELPAAPTRRVRVRRRTNRRSDPFADAIPVLESDDEMLAGDPLDVFVRGTLVSSLYTFEARGGVELSVHEGDVLRVSALSPDAHWVFVYHVRYGKSGFVPTSYLRPIHDLKAHQQKYVSTDESPSANPPTPVGLRDRVIPLASEDDVRSAMFSLPPCVAGWCLVEMASGERKPMRELKKGDLVRTCRGEAAVVCLLRTVVPSGIVDLVRLSEGLAITPRHPVRIEGVWRHPCDLRNPEPMVCEDLYLFLLSGGHTLFVDGIECVGLAHGFTDKVVAHSYLGTGAVVQDLRKMVGWQFGVVEIRGTKGVVRDPATGWVTGITG